MTLPRPVRCLPPRMRNVWLQHRPRRRVIDVPGVGAMACDTGDMIQRYLYQFGVWEPALTRLVRAHLRSGDVVVDVGANIGYYSLLAASLVGPNGRVVALEPSPTVRRELEANLRRNAHGSLVEIVPAAAGAGAGRAQVFRASGGNLGQTATQPSPGAVLEGEVEVRTVDACLAAAEHSRVRLVKVDVEGDELTALLGATGILRAMPSGSLVLVEVDEPRMRERGEGSAELFDLMSGLGFVGHLLENRYEVAAYVDPPEPTMRPLAGPVGQGDIAFVKQ